MDKLFANVQHAIIVGIVAADDLLAWKTQLFKCRFRGPVWNSQPVRPVCKGRVAVPSKPEVCVNFHVNKPHRDDPTHSRTVDQPKLLLYEGLATGSSAPTAAHLLDGSLSDPLSTTMRRTVACVCTRTLSLRRDGARSQVGVTAEQRIRYVFFWGEGRGNLHFGRSRTAALTHGVRQISSTACSAQTSR